MLGVGVSFIQCSFSYVPMQFRRILTTPENYALDHDVDITWTGLIQISEEFRKAWRACTPYCKKKGGYWIIEDGVGNRIAVKDVDLSSVQISKQANAREEGAEDDDPDEDDDELDDENGADRRKNGIKRARSTKTTPSKEPAIGGTLSDTMRERAARRREAGNAELYADVLVPASEGHTDDTPLVEELFRNIRYMV